MKKYFLFYVFIPINILLFTLSLYYAFDGIIPKTHANNLSSFTDVASHELDHYGILNVLLSKIHYLNIFFSTFFFLTICSIGTYCLKISTFNFVIDKFDSYEKNIIFYIGSFTIGSIIFVAVYRLISLNLPIKIVNFLFLTYITFFIFFYLYNIKNNFFIFIQNKKLIFTIFLVLILILILQIDVGGHHIIGDAFYNYGFKKIIQPLFNYEYIPIIGTHYFEEIFIFPIILFLQDFLYTSNLEQTTFQVMWSFQAFGKLSSICLVYICFRFFEVSKMKCLFFTIIICATNLSGNYLFNTLLYGSGNPFLLSIHTYRASGLILFIFISICFFLKPKTKNSLKNNLVSILFLVGLGSFGIQYAFLFVLFFLFIFMNEIGSIKIIKRIKNFLHSNFKISIILSIFFILLTYLIIGESLKTYNLAPYILMVPLILSFINFFSLDFSNNFFNIKNFFRLSSYLFLFLLILTFFGNVFTYKFLFPTSPSNIEFLITINKSIISIFSQANLILDEGKYIYRELIHYEEQNTYQLKNICTQKSELMGMGITGITNYHCNGGFINYAFAFGFIFLVLIYNSFIIKDIYSNKNKDNKDKYILFMYALSLFFFIFALFFNDMLDGKHLINARSRFFEISNSLIIFVFLVSLSKYFKNDIYLKLIIYILLIKFIAPFFVNLYNDGSWYINQIIENVKYLFMVN